MSGVFKLDWSSNVHILELQCLFFYDVYLLYLISVVDGYFFCECLYSSLRPHGSDEPICNTLIILSYMCRVLHYPLLWGHVVTRLNSRDSKKYGYGYE